MAVDIITPAILSRLKTRAEFLYVRAGRYAARPSIVIQCRKTPNPTPNLKTGDQIRVGFTATKKIGNAVTRNRAKRRMRACAQALLQGAGKPGFDYVFIARKDTATTTWSLLYKDVEKALSRLT